MSGNPWSIPASTAGTSPKELSFTEIMSEELANELQAAENKKSPTKPNRNSAEFENVDGILRDETAIKEDGVKDCEDDFLLAQLLQAQFDREHDSEVVRKEAKLNGNDKVRLSLENYRTYVPQGSDSEDSEDDEDWREFVTNAAANGKKAPDFGPSGIVKKHDGTLVSKHDKVINGRKNTSKVLQFPPGFRTGDATGFDLQLSNKVYNGLKKHSKAEANRHARLHEKKEASTSDQVFDANTKLVVFKMVNSGLLEAVNGCVSTGKEASVFHAFGGLKEDGSPVPAECALKIFKTTLNEFKNRSEYVKDDYRFKNPRKVLKIWAEKEMLNLNRMRRAEIRCPEVVKLRKHVLVLSFLGHDGKAAPKLKEVDLSEEALEAAFQEVLQGMKKMYETCSLVHGDLSEFNILYWENHCYIIDVSQAVDTSHPRSLVFLARDCHNIHRFFASRGLEPIISEREIFNTITGLNIMSDEKFYIEVQEYQTNNRPVQSRRDNKLFSKNKIFFNISDYYIARSFFLISQLYFQFEIYYLK